MEKPIPYTPKIIHWSVAMTYIEEKYGLETEGDAYFLENMGHLPKTPIGLVKLQLVGLTNYLKDTRGLRRMAQNHDMEPEDYRLALLDIIDKTLVEFPETNGDLYWEFG